MRAKDIAEQLGLSPATISLVLNNKPGVSQNTRQRILDAVAESNFNHPKISINNTETKIISFLVFKREAGDVIEDSQFLSTVIKGIGSEASEHDYQISISYINNNEVDNIESILESVRNGGVSGVLILATEMEDEGLKKLVEYSAELPVVIFDRFTIENLDTVVLDNIQGIRKATEYLISCGHKEIGFINSTFWLHNFEERFQGMKEALDAHDLPFNERHYCEITPTIKHGKKDMVRYLTNSKSLPTAFVAANDVLAIGAMRGVLDYGMKVPEEISIIGFDNLHYGEIIEPSLSTVKVFKERVGRLAVSRLISRIESSLPERIMTRLHSELVIRDSVADLTGGSKKINCVNDYAESNK